jgi:hypothetical protein
VQLANIQKAESAITLALVTGILGKGKAKVINKDALITEATIKKGLFNEA